MSETIAGIKIPDSQMAKDLTELIRDKEPDLLYQHSRRVYLRRPNRSAKRSGL